MTTYRLEVTKQLHSEPSSWHENVIEDRRILVFVSSTFQDLIAEREELVRHTFPRIRDFCNRRGIMFDEVDLRWGITDKQAQEHQILARCFYEIHRCRPFFLGLLGDRYGWVPTAGTDIPSAFLDAHPWLKEELGTSVTELEYLYGALHDGANATAWFYSRQPSSIDAEALESEETPQSRQRLQQLKQRLRDSSYPFREGFKNTELLSEWIYDDLTAAISRIYPNEEATPNDREQASHRYLAARQCIGFSGREREQEELGKLVQRKDRCVAILGAPGVGKTALACHWVHGLEDLQKLSPQKKQSYLARLFRWKLDPNWFPSHTLLRISGISESSRDPASLAYSLIQEISQITKTTRPLPQDPALAFAEFESWVNLLANHGPTLIVIAGLNQIDSDPIRAISWLPKKPPKDVHIVITVDDDLDTSSFIDVLKREKWATLHLDSLTQQECCNLVDDKLAYVGKHLESTKHTVQSMASRNPRFVNTIVEVIRSYGEFGNAGSKLQAKLDSLLASTDEKDLCERAVNECEQVFERDHPGLVGDSLSLLAVSYRGLSESDLLLLLGEKNRPLSRYWWTPLYASLKVGITDAGGLLTLLPGPLRDLVMQRYLGTSHRERDLRQKVVSYFLNRDGSGEQLNELLFQWKALGEWTEIAAWLGNLENWASLWSTHEFVLKQYFRYLQSFGDRAFFDNFKSTLERNDIATEWLVIACQLLDDLEERDAVGSLTNSLLQREQLSETDRRLALSIRGRFLLRESPAEALRVLQEESKLCDSTGNRVALTANLGNQAIALRQLNRFEEAATKHLEEEKLARELNDLRLLAGSLCNQTQIDIQAGRYRNCSRRLPELERISIALRDVGLLARTAECRGLTLAGQGVLDRACEKLNEAAALFHQAEDITAEVRCLRRLAKSCYQNLDWDSADEACESAVQLARGCGDDDLITSILAEQERLRNQFKV